MTEERPEDKQCDLESTCFCQGEGQWLVNADLPMCSCTCVCVTVRVCMCAHAVFSIHLQFLSSNIALQSS
jgi:hypothetical protein